MNFDDGCWWEICVLFGYVDESDGFVERVRVMYFVFF